jgi:hypothetical protein
MYEHEFLWRNMITGTSYKKAIKSKEGTGEIRQNETIKFAPYMVGKI